MTFVRHFLQTRRLAPRMDFVLRIVLGSAITLTVIAPFVPYVWMMRPNVVLTFVGVPSAMAASYVIWRQGYAPAGIFFMAWFAQACGIMFFAAQVIGWLPYTFATGYGMHIGSVLVVILFAYALAHRIKILTAEIALLEVESRMDELTQLANRRHFDRTFKREWKLGFRVQKPLSLLLVDIDHFKAYNDRYGHTKGDACLRQVADTIGATVARPTDLAARYGGEEFAIILPETDSIGAGIVAARLVEAIRTLQLRHEASPTEAIVTVSIGVATMQPEGRFGSGHLIEMADKALYRAKSDGRNRWFVSN